MFIVQVVPESPRYLVLNGKEDKAKKVLALIAKINCRPPLSGKLVTQEEKEQMLKERNQTTVADNEQVETSTGGSENCSNEIEADNATHEAQPNKEETELTMMSPDNESDSELLLTTDDSIHKHTLSWKYSKLFIRNKATKYHQWFLILFKNGFWRTTLLLWYLSYVCSITNISGALVSRSAVCGICMYY